MSTLRIVVASLILFSMMPLWAVVAVKTGRHVHGAPESMPGTSAPGANSGALRQPLWIRQFTGHPATNVEGISRVAVDRFGNVIIAGQTGGSVSGQDMMGDRNIYVQKRDPMGKEVWTRQFGIWGGAYLGGIAADSTGDLIMAVSIQTAPPAPGMSPRQKGFLRKLASDGMELWSRQFGGSQNLYPNAVGIDGERNIYVAGRLGGGFGAQLGGALGSFIRKYDNTGAALWSREYEGINRDWISEIALVPDGDMLPDIRLSHDGFISKFDSSGVKAWVREFVRGKYTAARSLALGPAGQVYVAGFIDPVSSDLQGTGQEGFLTEFDSTGAETWNLPVLTAREARVDFVAVDGSGRIFVAGTTLIFLPTQFEATRVGFVAAFEPPGRTEPVTENG